MISELLLTLTTMMSMASSSMATTAPFFGCDGTILCSPPQGMKQPHRPRPNQRGTINPRSSVEAFSSFSPKVDRIRQHQRVRRRHHHHQPSILVMSSYSSSSSSSNPQRRRRVSIDASTNSGGSGSTVNSSSGRNRGANAANHNRRGHSFRTSSKDDTTVAGGRRSSSTSPTTTSSSSSGKMNTKRPPRWEREGDRLYAEVTKDLNTVLLLSNSNEDEDDILRDPSSDEIVGITKPTSAQDVCRLLEPWTATIANSVSEDDGNAYTSSLSERKGAVNQQLPRQSRTNNTTVTAATTTAALEKTGQKENSELITSQSTPPPPFLWGSLPVGPVLASRLYATGRSEPTSVQRAAFSILTAAVSDNGSYSSNNDSYPASSIDSSRRNRRMGYPTTTKRSGATIKKKTIKRTNAIIASPTGTGKTLAYLLPLLCTSPGGQRGEGTGGILIVTPTIELACQIQREVDILWPPLSSSSLFVVGDGSIVSSDGHDEDDFDDERDKRWNEDQNNDQSNIPPGRSILRTLIRNQSPPIIAGTPKMLRMLYREVGRITNGDYDKNDDIATISDEERTTSIALCSNLRAIVLDEADRLLRTEAAAREATERKNRKIAQQRLLLSSNEATKDTIDDEGRTLPLISSPPLSSRKSSRLVIARQTQTEFLLRDLPIRSLDDVQIICASATVGRTMRRQLMQILDKPSADAAATLVTGEEDVRVKSKDVERRRGALLPDRLRHAYRVVSNEDVMLGEGNAIQKEGTQQYNEASTTMSTMTVAERNEEIRIKQTIATLWNTMMLDTTEAKPILIFPGKMGVDRVQKELMARGLEDIRTLRNLDGKKTRSNSASGDISSIMDEPDVDNSNVSITEAISTTQNANNDINNKWTSIPIYIIGERFARGLDLPDIEYVFILSPPSSAAGYAHMAGRTGRCGKAGVATTLVRPKNNEVSRLAAIAEALGLRFDPTLSGMVVSNEEN